MLFGITKIAQKSSCALRRAQFDANYMMLFATLGVLGFARSHQDSRCYFSFFNIGVV